MEQNIATAVNKEPFSITKLFCKCLPFQGMISQGGTNSDGQTEFEDNFDGNTTQNINAQPTISAIRLQISVNEVKCCRKISLKGVYGDPGILKVFISHYKKRIHELVSRLPGGGTNPEFNGGTTGGFGVNNTDDSNDTEMSSFRAGINSTGEIATQRTINYRSKNFKGTLKTIVAQNDDSGDEEDEENLSAAQQESSSIYQIHKILSSDQYTIGKNVSEYIQSFQQQYKNIKESSELLPQPLESIQDLINDLVKTFNMDFNLGKDQAKDIMPYCRTAIEKYLYQKVNDNLFAMYAFKNQNSDEKFATRQRLLL